MGIKEIRDKNEILARHIPSNAWAEGLGFYSNDVEFIQVGSWQYDKGKELIKQIPNPV